MLSEALKNRLLGAIESDSLVFICGAGLSIAPPSNLPSAADLAQECGQRYEKKFGQSLPAEALGTLEAMARYFYSQHQLVLQFIYQVVNWARFDADANLGHRALADFLESDAAKAVITTNYDCLIERAAHQLGDVAFEAVVDGAVVNLPRPHSPLLKLHGCWRIDKANTVWCAEQLADEPIRTRVQASTEWLRANLQQRDIVVLGFWTDWPHIVEALEHAVSTIEPRMVVVVDLQESAQLEAKAQALWDWANQEGVDFHHVQMSAADFLDKLRAAYSQNVIARVIALGKAAYEHHAGTPLTALPLLPIDIPTQDSYALRRGLFGLRASEPVRSKRPDNSMAFAGAAVILLKRHGGLENGGAFRVHGRRIRVVCGSQMLSAERAKFASELPDPEGIDLTICAGAHEDGGAPDNLVRSGHQGDVVRVGITEPWITLREAFEQLGVPQ